MALPTNSVASALSAFIAGELAALSIQDYGRGVRAAVRGLWSGALNQGDFIAAMFATLERGFEMAWREGAAECGIQPDERTEDEQAALFRMLAENIGYLPSFAAFIERVSRAQGGKLGALWPRTELWINRYKEVQNLAKTMACANQKLIWVFGQTEEHCRSCSRLAGKVKRASTWAAADIRPQHPDLECGGWRCDCRLEPTDQRLSPGPLPNIP